MVVNDVNNVKIYQAGLIINSVPCFEVLRPPAKCFLRPITMYKLNEVQTEAINLMH